MRATKPAAAPVHEAVRATRVALRRHRSPRRAAGMRAYFKRDETVAFYGVDLPTVRAVARDVWRDHRAAWTVADATRFCDHLIRDAEFEAKAVGMLVLARWESAFPRGLLRTARDWLNGGHAATWAAVDLLAPSVLTPLVARFPALRQTVVGWTTARSLWVRRAAAVTFVPLARRGEALMESYAVAAALLDDDEDLIHKAVGWLLREAGKPDPERLERFLDRYGPRIPRTTVRYAIERFPPAQRRRLLMATRADHRPAGGR
jgi:3-methyladenine DNA glycosylase AlkD